jgi:hypothetical protein
MAIVCSALKSISFIAKYHGYGGDLRIETPNAVGLGPEFVKAGKEFGYPSLDLNEPFTEGKV